MWSVDESMRILLLGEYSNVHATLADGLRQLGHAVTVVSNGDFWKNYSRDIDVSRKEGRWGGVRLMLKIAGLLPRLRGYDIVQLINPMFIELKAERLFPLYHYLRKHNKRVVLGAFGMDYYWVHENITRMSLRYSDFNIGKTLRTDPNATLYINDWENTAKGRLNQEIANDCDAIVAGLYEYWVTYHPVFPSKTMFIPFPIKPKALPTIFSLSPKEPQSPGSSTAFTLPLKLFIGISKGRSAYKGTDIMLRAAQDIATRYPEKVRLTIADGLPFSEYVEAMNESDVILDQLYSYTPAMNALEAMSRGIIVVGGGEPENYEILHENELRPIVNVEPTYNSVCQQLEHLVTHPELIPTLKQQGIEYIRRHHDYRKVAEQYVNLYRSLINQTLANSQEM